MLLSVTYNGKMIRGQPKPFLSLDIADSVDVPLINVPDFCVLAEKIDVDGEGTIIRCYRVTTIECGKQMERMSDKFEIISTFGGMTDE